MRANLVKKLAAGELIVGTMLRDVLSISVVDALLSAGFDFFVLDMEHTGIDILTAAPLLWYGMARGLPGIVRVPALDKAYVGRVLDCGATGIWLPHLDTPEEAITLYHLSKYPPKGSRGVTLPWPKRHIRETFPDDGAFLAHEDENILLVGQIESKIGVKNIASILDSKTLDAVVLGPNDLSTDLGLPGLLEHEKVREAVDTVLQHALSRGIPVGIHLSDEKALKYWFSKGMTFIVYSYDLAMMVEQAKRAIRFIKNN